MKVDRLFLERDCPTCGVIKANLSLAAATNDTFLGAEGQALFVFASQSNAASIDMMKAFGFPGKPVPFLATHDGVEIIELERITTYLNEQGMS
jgi:hypothetical protein